MLLIVRILDIAAPLMAESVTPGPSHWKTGVPVTPGGREMEQVRETVSPTRTGEKGGEVRVMFAASGCREQIRKRKFLISLYTTNFLFTYCDNWSSNYYTGKSTGIG